MTMRRTRPWLAILFAASMMTAHAAAKLQAIPLSFNQQGLPYAEFKLNGDGPHRMIVDTAAAMSALQSDIAEPAGAVWLDSGVNVVGLIDEKPAARVRIAKVSSGPFSANIDMAVLEEREALNDPDAAGLVGLDMLYSIAGDARYVELDFANGYIRAASSHRRLAPRLSQRWTTLERLADDIQLLAIPISIQGVEGVAVMDSGLDFAVLNTAYAEALKARNRGDFIEVGDVNADKAIVEVVSAKRIRGQGFAWREVRAMVLDPSAFDKLGLADQPAMLLGANFTGDLRIVLDRRERRVLIDAPGRRKEPAG